MSDLIMEVAKNANMGIEAIDSIKTCVKDDEFRNIVVNQREKLAEIKDRAVCEGDLSDEVKGEFFQNMMVRSATKMKACMDKSNKNIAQMLIEGNNLGINKIISQTHEANKCGIETPPLVGDLIELYDCNIKELRQYL